MGNVNGPEEETKEHISISYSSNGSSHNLNASASRETKSTWGGIGVSSDGFGAINAISEIGASLLSGGSSERSSEGSSGKSSEGSSGGSTAVAVKK